MWGGVPVHRGDYDRAAMDSVVSILHSGYPLLMAPEGGRSHEPGMRLAKPGIAFIVEQTGLPVIPVAIVGTTDDFFQKASHGKRPQLEMHIGKPFHLPLVDGKGVERRESRQHNADLVMRHIAGMLPKNYRGVYAENAILPDSDIAQ
jgi:1-acyl-sn-glycerol-3-phosphate acyltransferase